jgi:dihydrofolate synthase / folylpolyglutamate synthase
MKVTAYKTPLIKAKDDLFQVIADAVPFLPERSVVVVASKIVSTCENRFVKKVTGDREEKHQLVRLEAELYTDPHSSKYDLMLTVHRNWMFVNAGIDESNADNQYILWPKDPQQSVNQIWHFLREHYNVKEVGVTMSDSTSIPLNWGVMGHAIAHCGFEQLKSYIGKPDLFGRNMKMEQVNMAQGVTAAAVLEMGEGSESTPLAVVRDITDIVFQDHPPTADELAALHVELEDDVFAPILTKAEWKKGEKQK